MSLLFTAASSERVDVSGLSSLNSVAGWTLSAWFQGRAPIGNTLIDISVAANSNTRASLLVQSNGTITVQARAANTDVLSSLNSGVGVFGFGPWHFLAVTCNYQNAIFTIYYDGSASAVGTAANFTQATSGAGNSASAQIGCDAGKTTNFTDGYLEDARIYNRVLSPNEVITLFTTKGRDGILSGLTNRWMLKGESPGTNAVGNGTIVDIGPTATRRNGDPINTPVWSGPSISNLVRMPRIATGRIW